MLWWIEQYRYRTVLYGIVVYGTVTISGTTTSYASEWLLLVYVRRCLHDVQRWGYYVRKYVRRWKIHPVNAVSMVSCSNTSSLGEDPTNCTSWVDGGYQWLRRVTPLSDTYWYMCLRINYYLCSNQKTL